jgi:predicted dehydrogenase/threonine dehydrogenase-like Zn-dependent dehydrogenase
LDLQLPAVAPDWAGDFLISINVRSGNAMKQVVQNYKNGRLELLDVPVPQCLAGGVVVRTTYSVVSTGTEKMKVSESKLSLFGKARARPDQLKKVLRSVQQQGPLATYNKVMNRLDTFTPLGYSLSGEVVEIGDGVEEFRIGEMVACAGNQFAFHAEYNWVPINMCVHVSPKVKPDQAAFATIGAIALQAMRQAEIQFGETSCVIGLGLLGQILVRLLRGAGVFVVGVDIVEDRCRLAENGGAAVCAAAGSANFDVLTQKIHQLTGGHGADCIFITAGGADSMPVELAAELARDRARVVDVGKCRLELPWNKYYEKELDFRFSRSYGPGRYDPYYEEFGIDYPVGYVRWTERRNMECIIAMLADGRLDLAPLISRVFPFESAVQIYENFHRGEIKDLGIVFSYSPHVPLSRVVHAVPRRTSVKGKVRLGIIGAGNYASSMLLPYLAKHPDVMLQEVATTSALSATNALQKFGFARSSTEPNGLLQADDIDAVVIATRHATHAQFVCAALRAGKAVFVEKPLAISEEELAEVDQCVTKTGNNRLVVGFNRRFSPLLIQLKLDWGPRNGGHKIHYRINADQIHSSSWYMRAQTEGTRFAGEGGHFIDTISWWLGANPIRVTAVAAFDDIDDLTATYTYSDGSVATICYWTKGDSRLPKERIEIFGQGKSACFDNFQRYQLWSAGRKKTESTWTIDKGQKDQLCAFIGSVKSGGPMSISMGSLICTTRATLAAQRSIATNLPVLME